MAHVFAMNQIEILRKQLLKKTKEQINEKFAGKEIHIIKAVRLLSDLESVSNLLKENASEWKTRQPTGEAQDEYKLLEKNSSEIEQEKNSLTEFIEKEMSAEFPNFSKIATPVLGAKLLASAGSKKRLCFMPASTIQLLGAEKALFAHMRKGARSPKHGHLFNHPLLQNLPRFKRGKAARLIAGKLSIALKIDYFKGEDTAKEIQNELEDKIKTITEEPVTKEQEQKEHDYDAINSERRKQEFDKRDKRREYINSKERNREEKQNTEHKTFTPEERRAYFAKREGQTGNYTATRRAPRQEGFNRNRDNYSSGRPSRQNNRGDYEARENNYSGERKNYSRDSGNYSSNRGNYSNERSNYSSSRGNYSTGRSFGERRFSPAGQGFSRGTNTESFGEKREGHSRDFGRTKNKSFGKGRFNKPKHSFKRY